MKKLLRLDRVLANMGWGTRSEIKKMMKKGLVTIDGEIAGDPALKVDPERIQIEVAGEVVRYQEHIYLMLNKPAGFVSATEDTSEKTVLELLSEEFRHFSPFPVGRLDKDTEGLLLLTNDGQLAHFLTSPGKKVPKTYYAVVEGEVLETDREAFAQGVVLDDGYQTLPAELTVIKRGLRSEIELVIYEGKYHQVKRMFLARGKKVLYLRRIRMGPLAIDETLDAGQYRELTAEEIKTLRQVVELDNNY